MMTSVLLTELKRYIYTVIYYLNIVNQTVVVIFDFAQFQEVQ